MATKKKKARRAAPRQLGAASGKLKVFLSWSGERARAAAQAFAEWLPLVIQNVKPFVSTNIMKGDRSMEVIAEELEETRVGLVLVTPERKSSPWLLFEAGALSKTMSTAHVCVYLIGLGDADLEPPLSQFHSTKATEEDTFKLIQTINALQGSAKLEDGRLKETFDTFWPKLSAKLASLPEPPKPDEESRRDPVDMIEETLLTVRQIAKSVTRRDAAQAFVRGLSGSGGDSNVELASWKWRNALAHAWDDVRLDSPLSTRGTLKDIAGIAEPVGPLSENAEEILAAAAKVDPPGEGLISSVLRTRGEQAARLKALVERKRDKKD